MKRFTKFLVRELGEYFEILKEEFVYAGGQEADLYLVVKSLKEVLKRGPLVEMKKSAGDFKKRNREIFEKGGRIWGREKVNFSAREFLSGIGKGRMVERGVSGMEVRKKG